MTENNRNTERHRTLKGGKIVFNDNKSTLDCTVRNLSQTGCLLKVTSPIGIPDRFRLIMSDSQRFDCEIAWKRGNEIGVAFS
ncbi:PilZ domain-containing protein [Devosia rhodophyticola]|uniref:PilZ domain-containing protein n=1 Tax=Devosia rhodophyticola TaxID=3026423 RepID=A0ABY7YZ87_9HYPH|nr:PilZ domain-containing protein [Devosia rhodophyticola]WDR06562.1 PilZ domain-containing protein [Devosia rhodophyticola]